MKTYPKDITEFEREFSSEKQCLEYLMKIRYPDGVYTCPICGSKKSWPVRERTYECAECHHQESVLSGTIFQDTHKPLKLWFRAIWHVTFQKSGTSALGLQSALGIGSYKTAWTWLHKLRRAMVRPDRDRLSGQVEVGKTYIKASGKGKKGIENMVLVAIAVETDGLVVDRIRVGVITAASQASLHSFIQESVEPGSTVITNRSLEYSGLKDIGYNHQVVEHQDTEVLLPHIHTIISLMKRWIMGTLHGSCSGEHLLYYLDEFTFRFNRRKTKSRGLLFYRLLLNAVQLNPATYKSIIAKQEHLH